MNELALLASVCLLLGLVLGVSLGVGSYRRRLEQHFQELKKTRTSHD